MKTRVLCLLYFLSGLAGLGYQVAWSRMFAAGLGHEMPSVLATVGAVMGGMALGALLLGDRIETSPVPGRWYAALELMIGAWGILSSLFIPLANDAALRWVGLDPSPLRHWGMGFLFAFLALLPATACMGATLPAMERFLAQATANQTGRKKFMGTVYAANTFGAMAGSLGSAFALMPALGLRKTAWVFAAINFFCASAAWSLARHKTAAVPPAKPAPAAVRSRRRLCLTVFMTGLLGIGFEVVGVRLLSQVLENTVYTFASVLAVYLLGTSVGAACFQKLPASKAPRLRLSDLLLGIACASVLSSFILASAPSIYEAARARFGESGRGVMAAEMAVALAVFGPPTFFMGAAFSWLFQELSGSGRGIGSALALNTFGAGLSTVVFGEILFPWAGAKGSLAILSFGYLLLLPKVSPGRVAAACAALTAFFFLPTPFRLLQIPEQNKVAAYRDGVMASVAVLEGLDHQRSLRVNNRFQMGGTGAAVAERRHGHIPLLLRGRPQSALFLGLGTGITFEAAAYYPGLEADGVELVPEVLEVMPLFSDPRPPPGRARLRYHAADARRFVRVSSRQYDVIVADLFHPAQDGAGLLYTTEHFRAIRNRLSANGLFCQWLPLHQLDESMVQVIIKTFLEVFPEASAFLLRFNIDAPVLGLVGRIQPAVFAPDQIERELESPELARQLKKTALADSVRLYGCFLAGPRALRKYSADAELNTDDHPVVTFNAPLFTYRKNVPPWGRLLSLLAFFQTDAAKEISWSPSAPPEFIRQVSTFIEARDIYLKGLVAEAEGRITPALDAYVESARVSPDFTSGYAQCLTIASALAQSNPAAARALLQRLAEAQPERPVAREMLDRLPPAQ